MDSPSNTGVGCHAVLQGSPDPGIEPASLMSPALAGGFFTTSATWEALKESESEVAQLCPTLWDPMDCSPPGSSVHGTFQAGILEWLPFPSPGDLPNPGIKPSSPALQADTEPPGKPIRCQYLLFALSEKLSILLSFFFLFLNSNCNLLVL